MAERKYDKKILHDIELQREKMARKAKKLDKDGTVAVQVRPYDGTDPAVPEQKS